MILVKQESHLTTQIVMTRYEIFIAKSGGKKYLKTRKFHSPKSRGGQKVVQNKKIGKSRNLCGDQGVLQN